MKPIRVDKRYGSWRWTCFGFHLNGPRMKAGYHTHANAADAGRAHYRIVHLGAGGS